MAQPLAILLAIGFLPSLVAAAADGATPAAPPPAAKTRVLVWDERQPAQKQAYGDRMLGNTIADHLAKNPALQVRSVGMPKKGEVDGDPALTAESLEQTDVLIWWGHVRHREVSWATADRIVERVKANKLALVAVHSAHWASPFVRAMNEKTVELALASLPEAERKSAKVNLITPKYSAVKRDTPLTPTWERRTEADGSVVLDVRLPVCVFPDWRHDGKPSKLTTLKPDHPIAKGLPATWDISQTEMYNEPFHVPAPDVLIFEERFQGGEYFRSGALWDVGRGKVFYFRPGHETYPVFKEERPLKVMENAAVWLGEQVRGQKP